MEPPTTAPTAEDLSSSPPTAVVSQWMFTISQRFQNLLDKSTPYLRYRWIAFLCIALTYVVRVCIVGGFYVVSYALGIYLLNLLIGFLSPQVEPELYDGPTLPVRDSDEFRPFVRRLPEFKLWFVCLFYFYCKLRIRALWFEIDQLLLGIINTSSKIRSLEILYLIKLVMYWCPIPEEIVYYLQPQLHQLSPFVILMVLI